MLEVIQGRVTHTLLLTQDREIKHVRRGLMLIGFAHVDTLVGQVHLLESEGRHVPLRLLVEPAVVDDEPLVVLRQTTSIGVQGQPFDAVNGRHLRPVDPGDLEWAGERESGG